MIVRRILKGVLFLTILLVLIVLGIKFMPLTGDYGHHKMLIEFKDDLLKTTVSPKIILVGGSNVFLGVDSELLKYETGYEVVNMGVNGLYGYKIYFKLLENVLLGADDIVLFLPEYHEYRNNFSYFYRFLILYPSVVKYFDFPEDYSGSSFVLWLSTLGVKYLDAAPVEYSSKVLPDRYGDMLSNRLQNKDKLACDDISGSDFQYRLDLLNRLNDSMSKKGVKMLFGFPSLFSACYVGEQKTMVSNFYDFIEKNAKFSVVGNPERYLFERAFMYNTLYHVNFYGKRIRTERLIEDITPFLDKNILEKQLWFKNKEDFQKVSVDMDLPKIMKVNEKVVAKLKVKNEGFASMSYIQGYFVKVFDYKNANSFSFGNGGNSKPYELAGWSGPEDGFTWTIGNESKLEVPLDNVKNDVSMEVEVKSMLLKDNKPQVVNIYVGDDLIGSWNVSVAGKYNITIPRKYIVDSKLALTFKLPNAIRASDLGYPDERVLAVAFKSIKFNFPLQMPQVTTLEFDKNTDLNTGDSYTFDVPITAPEKPGVYRIKMEFHQMDNLIPGGVIDKEIKIVE